MYTLPPIYTGTFQAITTLTTSFGNFFDQNWKGNGDCVYLSIPVLDFDIGINKSPIDFSVFINGQTAATYRVSVNIGGTGTVYYRLDVGYLEIDKATNYWNLGTGFNMFHLLFDAPGTPALNNPFLTTRTQRFSYPNLPSMSP